MRYQYSDAPLLVSVDSGDDGRSSNENLPIWSVEVGSSALVGHGTATPAYGVWLGPEYSGLWALHGYQAAAASGTSFLISLPSMLFTMRKAEQVVLPRAAFGQWAGGRDWSNAVRAAITAHFVPPLSGEPPRALAGFQGLNGIPGWETEAVLHTTAKRAGALGLEAFTFDAGVYFPLGSKGDWWTFQGDYMPVRSRFPTDGFMALERNITQVQGLQYGMWITPQAQPGTKSLDENMGLYLSPAGNDSVPSHCCGLSYLLNLALPAAQELFFNQFETMVVQYNASRIWFDYNTASRTTHWNEHEDPARQGLLELGFYQGLYSVFERTLRKYPHVWIEGCASGGRMIDLGSLSHTHSMWINDDSVSDDRNRAKRGGANHFIPAHYLQNAFFISPQAIGGQANQTLGHNDRLLSYFNGVLQFGQGIETLTPDSANAVAEYVQIFKGSFRRFLDPSKANYYRLFQTPFDLRALKSANRPVPPASVTAPAGWVYEDAVSGSSGYVFVTRQVNCTSSEVVIPLSATGSSARPTWGRSATTTQTQRETEGETERQTPRGTESELKLVYVAGDREVTWTVAADHIRMIFPVADRGVLLSYGIVDSVV